MKKDYVRIFYNKIIKKVSLRSEVEAESTERYEKIKKEKEDVEEKLMNKKKDMKEAEQSFVKQVNGLEKDYALLSEKHRALEVSKKEMQESYEKEIMSLSNFSKNTKGDHQKEIEDYLKNSEELKLKVQSLSSELLEYKSNFEKDKVLWENKYGFLEAQRDNYKNELNESTKKYDNTIDSIQRKNQEEKDKIEKNLTDKINNIENKYTNQIKDLQEKHNNLYTELFNSNKNLEKENKNLKIELDLKTKSYDPTASNKTIEELNSELEKTKTELDLLRKNNLQKTNELRAQLEKEKDGLKLKVSDLESKMKDIESKRSHTIFEVELERGKWQNEKESLLSNINDLKDQIETLQSKNENLTKDKIKLQNEKTTLGRGKIGVSGTSRIGGGLSTGIGSSGLGSRGMGNPYDKVLGSFMGGNKFSSGLGEKGLDKILDADVSGIQNSSYISTNNNKNDFGSNKFSKYKDDDDDEFK